eukprot:gene14858-19973_t
MSTLAANIDNELWGDFLILISSVLFALAYVAERYAMLNGIGPLTYNFTRYFVSLVLLAIAQPLLRVVIETSIHNEIDEEAEKTCHISHGTLKLWYWGILAGLFSFLAATTQQIGLETETAGKVGFITGMSVVFVPITEWIIPCLGGIFLWRTLAAAIVATVGLYLVSGCATESCIIQTSEGVGEILVVLSMFFWTGRIIAQGIGSTLVDAVDMTIIDFFIVVILSLPLALIFETSEMMYPYTEIRENWASIIVVGVLDAAAFGLSSLGLMYTSASRCALILATVGIFTAIFGYFMLDEVLSASEFVGCALITIAVAIAYVQWNAVL